MKFRTAITIEAFTLYLLCGLAVVAGGGVCYLAGADEAGWWFCWMGVGVAVAAFPCSGMVWWTSGDLTGQASRDEFWWLRRGPLRSR